MVSDKIRPPLYVTVNSSDNVAIIVNEGGLPRGTQFPSGLVLIEEVPEAHKVALVDLAKGASIIPYGVAIGYAEQDIAKGSWVHEGLISLPRPPTLENLPLAYRTSEPFQHLLLGANA